MAAQEVLSQVHRVGQAPHHQQLDGELPRYTHQSGGYPSAPLDLQQRGGGGGGGYCDRVLDVIAFQSHLSANSSDTRSPTVLPLSIMILTHSARGPKRPHT